LVHGFERKWTDKKRDMAEDNNDYQEARGYTGCGAASSLAQQS